MIEGPGLGLYLLDGNSVALVIDQCGEPGAAHGPARGADTPGWRCRGELLKEFTMRAGWGYRHVFRDGSARCAVQVLGLDGDKVGVLDRDKVCRERIVDPVLPVRPDFVGDPGDRALPGLGRRWSRW